MLKRPIVAEHPRDMQVPSVASPHRNVGVIAKNIMSCPWPALPCPSPPLPLCPSPSFSFPSSLPPFLSFPLSFYLSFLPSLSLSFFSLSSLSLSFCQGYMAKLISINWHLNWYVTVKAQYLCPPTWHWCVLLHSQIGALAGTMSCSLHCLPRTSPNPRHHRAQLFAHATSYLDVPWLTGWF